VSALYNLLQSVPVIGGITAKVTAITFHAVKKITRWREAHVTLWMLNLQVSLMNES